MTRVEKIEGRIKDLFKEAIENPNSEMMRALAKQEKVSVEYDFKSRKLKAKIVKENVKEISVG